MPVTAPEWPSLRLLRGWDARLLANGDSRPATSCSAILLWDDPSATDGGVPAPLVQPLAQALASLGEVAFRVATPPANCRALGQTKGWAASRLRSWHMAATSNAGAVDACFEEWSQGDQVAIVGVGDDDRVRRMLAADRLDAVSLAPGELLVAAIVDGAGILLCAADTATLDRAVAAISHYLPSPWTLPSHTS